MSQNRKLLSLVAFVALVVALVLGLRADEHEVGELERAERRDPVVTQTGQELLPAPGDDRAPLLGELSPVRSCGEDRGCEVRMRCVRGGCLDGARACLGDGDCGDQARCAEGSCVPRPRECWDDAGCPDDSRCLLGVCFEDRGACELDPDCQDGARECVGDGDCAEDSRCVLGLCAP